MVNSSIHLLVGGMEWQLGILQQVSAVNYGSEFWLLVLGLKDLEKWPLDKLNQIYKYIVNFKRKNKFDYMTSWSSYRDF